MRAAFTEPAEINEDCEIRLGVASWDDGSGTEKSVKYTWFNKKDGKALAEVKYQLTHSLRRWILQSARDICDSRVADRKKSHKEAKSSL